MRIILWRAVFALTFSVASDALVAQAPASAAGMPARVFDADSASFWITAPPGWDLDLESGRNDKMIGVLYKHGQSWRTGEPVMYMRVVTPDVGYNAVVPAAIRSDSADWGGTARDLVFTPREDLRTTSGLVAYVRTLQSASSKHFDSVAYLQGEGRVWMIELAARTREAHDAAYADFISLVKSYKPGPEPTTDR